MWMALELFVMLVLANGVPVLAARICKDRWNWPVDGHRLWRDGRPLLGPSKTWRGLICGTLACALYSLWMETGFLAGLAFGLVSLLGDMASSFVKRRMGLASSARAPGLDQLPEAVLPMPLALVWLPAGLTDAVLAVLLFCVSHIAFSPLLHRLGIRKNPH